MLVKKNSDHIMFDLNLLELSLGLDENLELVPAATCRPIVDRDTVTNTVNNSRVAFKYDEKWIGHNEFTDYVTWSGEIRNRTKSGWGTRYAFIHIIFHVTPCFSPPISVHGFRPSWLNWYLGLTQGVIWKNVCIILNV